MSLAGESQYVDCTLKDAIQLIGDLPPEALQRRLSNRLSALATEQSEFRAMADRFDELYYTTTFTEWGADVWADDPSATTPGRSHISLNSFSVYVDVPASLQAYEPIENMLSIEDDDDKRMAAQAMERVRKAWKIEERWQLKRHKAAVIKGIYGRTASFVYYDKAEKRMCADVIQNPRNLYLGYKNTDYEALEWAAHVSLVDPTTLMEQFSVEVTAKDAGQGKIMPWVVAPGSVLTEEPRASLTFGPARIEVWDYWYRVPGKRGKRGEPTEMETWNVVIAGNEIVRGPFKYAEYEGDMPYKSLRNTFIPGTPTGRSDLHDMEQLIREKMIRLSQGAQMIAKATAGDYWQLIGENPPSKGAPRPKVNEVTLPGPGNRIEAIIPFVAQFQLEQYMGRLDREKAVISGLNDMLLGLAPTAVLNSSKAINALVANYEARISMRRLLFYDWDRETWNLGLKVWKKHDKTVREIVEAGGGVLEIMQPSLSPRDEMETASRAANLVNAKLISQARGMDMVGVDDPEQEQNIIREERTDATLWPADVQVMAQLMGVLQSLGLQAPANAQAQVGAQGASGQEALRQALGAGTPENEVGGQSGTLGETPPITGADPNAGGSPAPFATQAGAQPGPTQMQGMLQDGKAKSRIMTSSTLGRR